MRINHVFRRQVRFNFPDGTHSIEKLPEASGLPDGAKCNIMLVWPRHVSVKQQHFVIVWFERVKGGWRYFKTGGKA